MNYKNNKYFIIIIVIVALIFTSCSQNGEKYTSIEDTLSSIDSIGNRVLSSDGNDSLAEALSQKLKSYNSKRYKFEEQKLNYNIPSTYQVILKGDDKEVILDNSNSNLLYYNNSFGDLEDVEVINSFENASEDKKYLYIANSYNELKKSSYIKNVALVLFVKDAITPMQSVPMCYENTVNFMYIDKAMKQQLEGFLGKTIDLGCGVNSEKLETKNIFTTIKGKDSSSAIVLTAHFDAITHNGDGYSNGIIDNGSGVALVLDLLKTIDKSNYKPKYDIVFSFVNAEELYLFTEQSGSYNLNKLLSERYKNIINLNLDCLGEPNTSVISYGFSENMNDTYMRDLIKESIGDEYSAFYEKSYPSDNNSFENSIFLYNMKIYTNDTIHSQKDNITGIDIASLNKISDIAYDVLMKLDNSNVEDIVKK